MIVPTVLVAWILLASWLGMPLWASLLGGAALGFVSGAVDEALSHRR